MGICPRGLIVDLITPADSGMGFDCAGYARLFERAASAGSAVFINSISAGEALFLPAEIRREVVCFSVDALKGRLPLFAGITGRTAAETAANAEFVRDEIKRQDYKGDVFLVDAPLCYRGNRGLCEHYKHLAAAAGLPIILLNDPEAAAGLRSHIRRRNIRTNVLKKLSMNEDVRAIAHNGTITRSLNYIKAVRCRNDFCFYDADEKNFLNSPGSGGVISIGANIFPGGWRRAVASSFGEDESRKRSESYRVELISRREKIKSLHLAYRQSPAVLVKAVLKQAGIISSDSSYTGERGCQTQKQDILRLSREILSGTGE